MSPMRPVRETKRNFFLSIVSLERPAALALHGRGTFRATLPQTAARSFSGCEASADRIADAELAVRGSSLRRSHASGAGRRARRRSSRCPAPERTRSVEKINEALEMALQSRWLPYEGCEAASRFEADDRSQPVGR